MQRPAGTQRTDEPLLQAWDARHRQVAGAALDQRCEVLQRRIDGVKITTELGLNASTPRDVIACSAFRQRPASRADMRLREVAADVVVSNSGDHARALAPRHEVQMVELSMHSLHSTLRERIVEHVFVGEALRTFWRRGVTDVEVLRSEFDAYGYDLVMGRGSIVRHIQFKTGVRAKPGRVSVSRSLAGKPSGCVIWISVSLELDLGPFWWFGGEPGAPLPDLSGLASPKRVGRRESGERPLRVNHSRVPASQFRRVPSLDQVLELLFGSLPSGEPPVLADDLTLPS